MGIPALNGAYGIAASRNKMRSLQMLSAAGVPVPRTVMASDPSGLKEMVRLVGGVPVLVKLLSTSGKTGVMICESLQSLEAALEAILGLGQNIVVQQYLKGAKGRDLRVLVVGGEVVAAMRRSAPPGRLSHSLRHGARFEPADLAPAYARAALRAARVLQLEVCAVDMLDVRGGPRVFEVNSSPPSARRRPPAAWTPRAASSIAPWPWRGRAAARGRWRRPARPECVAAAGRPWYRAPEETSSMRLLALLFAVSLAPLARADEAAAEAARSYRIETEGTTRSVKAGAGGVLVITIVPLNGTHVHPQAPLKIALQATPGLSLSKSQLGHKDAVQAEGRGAALRGAVHRGEGGQGGGARAGRLLHLLRQVVREADPRPLAAGRGEVGRMRIVYGVNPVRELLRAGGEGLGELWLAEGSTRGAAFAELERLGRAAHAKVHAAPRAKLDRLAGTDRHQGVVAVVADFRYAALDGLLAAAGGGDRPPLVVVLDGVEDPHNLGAIIRSAHALGAHGVIIPKDRAVGVTPAVAKASAGAVERCPVARVTNVAKTVEALKEEGIWSVALVADGERPLAEVDLRGPIALVLGSEGEGIRPLVRRTLRPVGAHPHDGRSGQPLGVRLGGGGALRGRLGSARTAGEERPALRARSAGRMLEAGRRSKCLLDKKGSVILKTPLH